MPTLLDLADAEYPTMFKGKPIPPCEGKSLVPVFRNGKRQGHDSPSGCLMGNRAVRVTVIEFGDAAQPDGFAKIQKAAGPFRNRDTKQGFLLFTHGCTLGDMPQTGKIHVSAG